MPLSQGEEEVCIGDRLKCLSISETPNDYELKINSVGQVLNEHEGDSKGGDSTEGDRKGDGMSVECGNVNTGREEETEQKSVCSLCKTLRHPKPGNHVVYLKPNSDF